MNGPQIVRVPLEEGLRNREIAQPGAQLVVLAAPADAEATVRVDTTSAEDTPLADVGGIEWCREGFSRLYFSAKPVPGGELVVAVCPEGVRVLPHSGGGGGVSALYDPAREQAAAGSALALAVDALGRLYVRLADRLDSQLDSVTAVAPPPVSLSFSLAAADNNGANARAVLDLGGRPFAEVRAELGGAGDVMLEGSHDGGAWVEIDRVFVEGAYITRRGVYCWRYLRLRTAAVGVSVRFDLAAKG